jgi:hypothetical protein
VAAVGDYRLDPLDEARRLWMLLTASERVRFLAWIVTAPDCQRPRLPLDSRPMPVVRLAGETDR